MSDVPGRSQWSSPDPVAVAVRARFVILAAALVGAVAGGLSAGSQEATYSATAVVVVEDSRSQVLERASTDIERYVASQAAVIRSEPVAAAASEALAVTGIELTTAGLLDGLRVSVEDESDVISVRLTTDDAVSAQEGATAVVRAYADLVRSSIRTELESSRDRLDEEIAAAVRDLDTARLRVADLRSAATADVGAVVDEAADALTTPPEEDDDAGPTAVVEELAALRALAEFEERDPELAAALRAQADLEFVVRELAERRAALTADISLVGSGVAFITDAGPGRANRFSTAAAVLLGGVLGGGAGLALAYLRASRRRPETPEAAPGGTEEPAAGGPHEPADDEPGSPAPDGAVEGVARATGQPRPSDTAAREASSSADEVDGPGTERAERRPATGVGPAPGGDFVAGARRSLGDRRLAALGRARSSVPRRPEARPTPAPPPVVATATTDDDGEVVSIELAVLDVMIALEDDTFEVPPTTPIVTAIVTHDAPSVALELGRRLAVNLVDDGPVLLVELVAGVVDEADDHADDGDHADGDHAERDDDSGGAGDVDETRDHADEGDPSSQRVPDDEGEELDVVRPAGASDVDDALAAAALEDYDEVVAVLALGAPDTEAALQRLQPHRAVVVCSVGHEADATACWDQVRTTSAHQIGVVVVDDHASRVAD